MCELTLSFEVGAHLCCRLLRFLSFDLLLGPPRPPRLAGRVAIRRRLSAGCRPIAALRPGLPLPLGWLARGVACGRGLGARHGALAALLRSQLRAGSPGSSLQHDGISGGYSWLPKLFHLHAEGSIDSTSGTHGTGA